MGIDAVAFLFVLGSTSSTNTDFYINPYPEGNKSPITNVFSIQCKPKIDELLVSNKSKLLYQVNKLTDIYWLGILPLIAPNIFAIAHKEDHLDFSYCYKIIAHSWFICSLIKLLRSFIWYYLQCLALQTKYHLSYRLLQPIESPLVFFFILTLGFLLAFLLTKKKFNVIILVICKFSNWVTLIEGTDTWSAED